MLSDRSRRVTPAVLPRLEGVMDATATRRIEGLFSSLVPEEKARVISQGVALRRSDLRRRLQRAESRMHHVEEKCGKSLDELEARGLPDDADDEMHEDYIMACHGAEVVEEAQARIAALQEGTS
jgi:hypothetical protein